MGDDLNPFASSPEVEEVKEESSKDTESELDKTRRLMVEAQKDRAIGDIPLNDPYWVLHKEHQVAFHNSKG
jgi:hypothetical protein